MYDNPGVRSIGKSGFRFSKSKSGFPNRTHPQMQLETFWGEIAWPPASYEAETITCKGSIKTKWKAEIFVYIRVVLTIKLRLIVMSTDLECRERERKRKR